MSILSAIMEDSKRVPNYAGIEQYGEAATPTYGQIASDRFGEALGYTSDFIDIKSSQYSDKPITLEQFDAGNYDSGVVWHEKMTEEEARILSETQQENRRRERNSANATFGQSIFGFGATILDSFTDPVNIATAFIPVVGVSKKLSILADTATSPYARAGYRAKKGFIQGAVGNVYAEPFYQYQMDKLQLDYTMADSLLNIALGGVVGSGLNIGVGLGRDLLAKNITLDSHAQAVKMAVNQVEEGRPIDVDPIVLEGNIKAIEAKAQKEIERFAEKARADDVRVKAEAAAVNAPEPRVSELGKLEGKGTGARYKNYKINNRDLFFLEGMNDDLQASTKGGLTFIDNVDAPGQTVIGTKSTSPDWFQTWNKTVTANNKFRAKEKRKGKVDLPPSQSILTKEKTAKILDKLRTGKPLGKAEGETAKDLLEIARSIREENINDMVNYRLNRARAALEEKKQALLAMQQPYAEAQSKPYQAQEVIDRLEQVYQEEGLKAADDYTFEEVKRIVEDLDNQGLLSKEEIEERAAIEAEGKSDAEYKNAFTAAATCITRSIANAV